ncbi:MAG: hypothetical protein ACREBU_01505 [Nitrososphaera sp.]
MAVAEFDLDTQGGKITTKTLTASSTVNAEILDLSTEFTVAGLPTCDSSTNSQIRYVNNALAPAYNTTIAGGGTVKVLVLCNGTNWTAH